MGKRDVVRIVTDPSHSAPRHAFPPAPPDGASETEQHALLVLAGRELGL